MRVVGLLFHVSAPLNARAALRISASYRGASESGSKRRPQRRGGNARAAASFASRETTNWRGIDAAQVAMFLRVVLCSE
jgi:hypothetical protein